MAKSERGQRGKGAEAAVEKALTGWSDVFGVEWHRMPDARSAMGRFPAQPADYIVATPPSGGKWLEVKETAHEYRLPKDKLSQLGKLRLFNMARMPYAVLVLHTSTGLWRYVPPSFFGDSGMPPSWDLREVPTYASVEEALKVTGWFQ